MPVKVTMTARTQAAVARLERVGRKMEREVREEVSHSAFTVQDRAYARAPVRTGWLRDHIDVTFENGGITALVGTRGSEVPYAPFQKKFLQPAARGEKGKFLDRLSARLDKADG